MIPTSDLNPLGQVFERQFIRAWELFETEKFDEANSICKRLVAEPRISYLHKAGCHLILAHSPDDYVYHAEQALTLFKNLYEDPQCPPNEEEKASQEELIRTAEGVLERAKADAKLYAKSAGRQQSMESTPAEIKRLNTTGLRSILEARKAAAR